MKILGTEKNPSTISHSGLIDSVMICLRNKVELGSEVSRLIFSSKASDVKLTPGKHDMNIFGILCTST